MFHTVVGLERGTWSVWQAQLLAWSFKRAGEPGPLTFIEAGGVDEVDHGDVFETVNYRFAGHDDYPREQPEDQYPPYNRLYGLRDWLAADGPREDTLVIVDCDFAWFERFDCPEAMRGSPWAQDWMRSDFMRWHCDDYPGCQAFGVPLVMHRDDLALILPRWIERTHAYRDNRKINNRWMSEMYGMSAAAQLEGLTFSLGDFDDGAIAHYYPYREELAGRYGFNKHNYVPWEHVPVEGTPLNQRLATLINEYAACHS
jgi:hypothetical protein